MSKRRFLKSEFIIFMVLAVFFAALFFRFGVQEYPDSETYIRMYLGREPVYPLFLQLLKLLFGEGFQTAAGILQNMLAVFSIWLLVCYLRKTFSPGITAVAGLLGIFAAPHLLTPVGSASHMVYTNSILSEGISYSVFNLMAYFLLRLVLEEEKRRKDLTGSACMALLLTLTRSQMLPMLLVWGCVAAYAVWTSGSVRGDSVRRKLTGCLAVLVITAVLFPVRNGLMLAYHYYVKDVYAVSLGGGTTFLTNVIYAADYEDGDRIEDPGIRNTFYYIQEKAEEQGWNYKAAGPGLLAQAAHLEESHDLIKFNQVELFITWHLNNTQGLEGRAREVRTDEVAMEIARQVLPRCLPRWLAVYGSLVLTGFIRTIAVIHPLLNLYALVVYLAAAGLMLYLFRRQAGSKAARFMLFVFLLICANVFATSITIMCLSRYMIYNMSLFYAAGLMMLCELVRNRNAAAGKRG